MRLSSYSQEPSAVEPSPGLTNPPQTGPRLTGNPARDLANSFNIRVIFFLSLHLPLALLADLSPWISTAYALAVLLFGLRAALLGRTSHVLYAVGYVAAGEVLWRMTDARLFWEYSKYSAVLILFVAIIVEWSQRGRPRRLRTLAPVLLMAALVPASVFTTLDMGIVEARDPISFNLSTHLMIAVFALFIWARPINRDTAVRMLLATLAPILGITFLAIYFTITDLDSLIFLGESNWITSGNYGPNQVSGMMGFGAFIAAILFIIMPRAWGARAFVLLMLVAMLIQGLLTFSRGGIYSFILALGVFGFHLMRTPKARGRLVLLFTIFSIILVSVIYPALDRFTAGSVSQRFTDLDTTGRFEAAQAELDAFLDNPFLGAGVGGADSYRQEFLGFPIASHTEYTRLLGEHGLFGILIIVLLVWMLLKRYLANEPGIGRALSAGLAVWSLSMMLHAATRLAAIPLAVALALAFWQIKEVSRATEPEPEQQTLVWPEQRPLP